MKVFLFDIDGTLLFSGGAGKRAMEQAFAEVYGVNDGFAGISMSGKTDVQIVKEALGKLGLPFRSDELERFRQKYFAYLAEGIKKPLPGKGLVPGVKELLQRLSAREDALIGLLTGNWRQSAYIKLGYFGIDSYFPFGAFADDSEDRDELLPIALQRAAELTGRELFPRQAWVIGDTPRDVHCGIVHGARVLGVTASGYGRETLLDAGATAVVDDFSEPETVLKILLDEQV